MLESILESIRKQIGPTEVYEHFDQDLMMHINSILAVLTMNGVGPTEGFQITGPNETWEDFIGNDKRMNMVVSYVGIRVKIIFDPPQSSAALEALKENAKELGWYLGVAAEYN